MAALRSLAANAFEGAVGTLVHFMVEQGKLSPTERRKLLDVLSEEPQEKDER